MMKNGDRPKATPKPIYYSTRVRLNHEQRNKLLAVCQDSPEAARGSYEIDHVRDLLSSSESIPVVGILRLQARLGTEIISRYELMDSFLGYLDYIFSDKFLNYD